MCASPAATFVQPSSGFQWWQYRELERKVMTSPSVWGVAKLIWGGAICYSYISNWWGSHRLCPRRLLWKWVQGMVMKEKGLPWWLSRKESASQWRRYRFDPWVWKTPGWGNGNPLQYFCLGNPKDIGAWWVRVHRVAKESDMTEWLNHNMIHYFMSFYSRY